MNIPVKSLKNGFALPVYGLGTWQMGGGREADHANDDVEIAAIQYALDQGITHIDTAELYGVGHCEELIGVAIKGRKRSDILLASKVLRGMDGGYDGVLRACEASLTRLKTDYLDLYMLHSYPAQGIADVMKAMDRLVSEGVVKNIGVCNMSVNRLRSAQSHSTNKIVSNQLHYGVQCREAETRGVLEYCRAEDVLVTAWGPLQKGTLEQAGILQELARKYNKTPYQVALNWLITQEDVVTIPKTTQQAHLDENLGALGWELDPEDHERLTKDFPNQQMVSERVPLDYPADVPV